MSVEEFCAQVGISRASFYRIRRRAEHEGLAAALTPRSRAPRHPARVWDQGTDERIAQVRADLLAAGREAGPASVWWVMSQGASVPAPSRATIARSLRRAGLVVPAPRKRPRTSYKRFTRSAANELWQIDGFQWRLEDHLVTVYQVVDDCSRVITALRACWGGESVAGTRMVLEEAFATWGRPAAILSDNALAFNTSRITGPGATEKWLASLGVRPISGRVGHPQTQGKVERSHQPAAAWLRAHPASTLEELNAELDRFTSYYKQHRAPAPGPRRRTDPAEGMGSDPQGAGQPSPHRPGAPTSRRRPHQPARPRRSRPGRGPRPTHRDVQRVRVLQGPCTVTGPDHARRRGHPDRVHHAPGPLRPRRTPLRVPALAPTHPEAARQPLHHRHQETALQTHPAPTPTPPNVSQVITPISVSEVMTPKRLRSHDPQTSQK